MTVFTAAVCLVVTGFTNDPGAKTAVFLSALLATANGLCALALSHVGSKRQSTKAFFGAVLGGMLLRMGTTLGGFVIGLKVLLLPVVPLTAALLSFTACFTVAEVTLWSRQNFSPKVQLS
jgi:branched-subunit amino acid ABC-type transport system permease component